MQYSQGKQRANKGDVSPARIISLYIIFGFGALCIIIRLFVLQIIEHGTYEAIASGQYEIFQELYPTRGSIYLHDDNSINLNGEESLYPLATNKITYEVYAQPKFITNPEETAGQIFELLDIPEGKDGEVNEERGIILARMQKEDDPYEMIKKNVEQAVVNKIKEKEIIGIGFRRELQRFYPEKELASNILGFVRKTDEGKIIGQYGVEGYYNELLSGKDGHLRSERDAFGRWIALSDRDFEQATDGADIVLTINKSIQFHVCKQLMEAVEIYQAKSASAVVLDPQTGAVIAMCNFPTFDPNIYNKVEDVEHFNNIPIYSAYEPGSIFKPVTLAGSLDKGSITPNTVYHDTGSISYNNAGKVETDPKKIIHSLKNYQRKVHGSKTMTEVLEYSINTGTVFSMQEMGTKSFRKYVHDFGFGKLIGIGLDTESKGNLQSLEKKGEIFSATASFGQGITVTPLQMVAAYSVFANGGKLIKPYIVEEIRHSNGDVDKTQVEEISQPINSRTAALMTGMLISVVDSGHATHAAVPGYYIAGKTGTAQVAERGIYGENTIHSFVGFGPSENAKFVAIVRIDHPQEGASSSATAAKVFGNIARFILDYYRIPPER